MGNPNEAMSQMSSNNMPRSSSHSRATFSGATACIGVITLILSIVSVSVPHWGVYSPKAGNLANGKLFVYLPYIDILFFRQITTFIKSFCGLCIWTSDPLIL